MGCGQPCSGWTGNIGRRGVNTPPVPLTKKVRTRWTNRSAFAVVHDGGEVLGLSWTPHFPGTNPKEADGEASWSGPMAGVDTGDGGAMSGRVLITLDGFSDPEVEVSFIGVRMIASGTPVGGMSWENLPVSQGSFSSFSSSSITESWIEGRFHGDRHQEAGGVFGHGAIVGAFGAARDWGALGIIRPVRIVDPFFSINNMKIQYFVIALAATMTMVYRSDNAESDDGIGVLRMQGVPVSESFQMPDPELITFKGQSAKSTKKHQAALINMELEAAMAPVWQGITMIRDPYSNAGEGQVILTANMLFGMVMRRTDGWRKYGIRTEA